MGAGPWEATAASKRTSTKQGGTGQGASMPGRTVKQFTTSHTLAGCGAAAAALGRGCCRGCNAGLGRSALSTGGGGRSCGRGWGPGRSSGAIQPPSWPGTLAAQQTGRPRKSHSWHWRRRRGRGSGSARIGRRAESGA